MQTPFASMTIDQLAAIAQDPSTAKSVPNQTIVMPFRTLAPQDEPRPQVAQSVPTRLPPPPAANVVPSGNRKGRKRLIDTTSITELPVIARRCARAYLVKDGQYERISKPASLAIVNYLESLGKPVERVNLATAQDGVEVLVFG